MMPCKLPFSNSTGNKDLKLQDLPFCVRKHRQGLELYGWYKPDLIVPNLGLHNGICGSRI